MACPSVYSACHARQHAQRGGAAIHRSSDGRSALPSIVAAFLAVLALLGSASPSAAHAELVSSEPAPNASLEAGPEQLTISFSEPIDAGRAFVDLLDAAQRRLSGVGPVIVSDDGRTLSVALPALTAGVVTVTYQVVSAVDGHATAGRFAFLVDPTGAAAPPVEPPSATSPSVDGSTVAARWVALIGLLAAFGGTVVRWRERVTGHGRRGLDRLIVAACVLAIAGVAAYLLLAGRPIVAALGPTGLPFDPASAFGWSPFAVAMRVSMLAALATAIVTLVGRGGPLLAPGLAAIALAGMSGAGHAASIGGVGFAVLDWVHLLAVGAWLGALPALFVVARNGSGAGAAPVRQMLRRHGRIAMVAAPIVALTGLANSPLVLGSARNAVASEYGNLLVAKALVLAMAVGIGAVNHLALRDRGRAAVAGLVAAELVLAVIAVGAAAAMVTTQPASARQPVLSGLPITPAHLFGEAGPSRVHVTLNPPAPGQQSVQVSISDLEAGGPRSDVQRVFLTLAPPAGDGLPSERIVLSPDSTVPGLFTGRGAFTPLEGQWDVGVVVRRAGQPDASVTFSVPIAREAPLEPVPPPDTGIGVPPPLAIVWAVVPEGIAGWLLALAALALFAVADRFPVGSRRMAVRSALGIGVVVIGVSAGLRGLVDAANEPPASALGAPPVTDPQAAARGEVLYLANCTSCHGRDGDGNGPIVTVPAAGPLGDPVAETDDATLAYRIANGVAGTPMPPFAGRLTEAERWDVVSWLRSRWPAR